VGVPNRLQTDGAKELTLGKWKDIREKVGGISQTTTEPHSPWHTFAKGEIKELKK
jgi:hypothetical protein